VKFNPLPGIFIIQYQAGNYSSRDGKYPKKIHSHIKYEKITSAVSNIKVEFRKGDFAAKSPLRNIIIRFDHSTSIHGKNKVLFDTMTEPTSDSFSQIYHKDPAIVARLIADEMILVPIRQSAGDLDSIYLLNETAQAAWALFDGSRTVGEIRTTLSETFAVDEGTAGQDLLELVANLERVGALIRI
jgi:hypothetical protein